MSELIKSDSAETVQPAAMPNFYMGIDIQKPVIREVLKWPQ
jgi:hypothetical protein